MRNLVAIFVTASLLLAPVGCRSQQLETDQDHIRRAVLELQTNQIMDNLIRIRRGLPIIQLDYNHMTGTITDTATGTVSGSDTNVGARAVPFPTGAAPSFAALTRTFTNMFGFSAGGMRVNQLTVNAEPVQSAPEVYNAYLEFLKDPSHLVETSEPPSPDEALIVRCRERGCCDPACAPRKFHDKVYYWVPCAFKPEFFRLSLYVVAVRGQPTPVSPNFDVVVKGFKGDVKPLKVKNAYEMTVVIDKEIPNDKGSMIATIKGRILDTPALLQIRPVPASPKPGAKTDNIDTTKGKDGTQAGPDTASEFLLSFNLDDLKIGTEDLKVGDVVKELTSQKVGIRLEHFFPTASPTDRLLEDIRYQLELNRLGQFQLAH